MTVNPESVLFITLDSCRYDTFLSSHNSNSIPNIASVGPMHKAQSPSYFTFGSHSSFWMGFTPGVTGSTLPFLNPKAGKLFRMAHAVKSSEQPTSGFTLFGSNIIEGFRRLGYLTLGSGAVEWFNTSSETGRVLTNSFDHFYFSRNTWSLKSQLSWINSRLTRSDPLQPVFVFLNIGETHVPYWYDGASWPQWPSPCVPFGGSACSSELSRTRQRLCLEWVDKQLDSLIRLFLGSTILVCSDHGDCWGEDGLWEHGISHPSTLTVPLLLRVRGTPI